MSGSVPWVLIVDDDTFFVEVMIQMLAKWNIKPDFCFSGKDALDRVKQLMVSNGPNSGCMYDLILVDYKMPVMDGPEFIKSLRKLLSESANANNSNIKTPYICCCTEFRELNYKK